MTTPTQARPALNLAICLGSLSMTTTKSTTAVTSTLKLYYLSFPTKSTPSSIETSTNRSASSIFQTTFPKPSPPSLLNMLWVHGAVSTQRWEPIFDVRTRPTKVQTTAMDLLRQLTELRRMPATLPSIDTLALPPLRQLRVAFGDMNALCDAIVSASSPQKPSDTKVPRNTFSDRTMRSGLRTEVQTTGARCGLNSTRYVCKRRWCGRQGLTMYRCGQQTDLGRTLCNLSFGLTL